MAYDITRVKKEFAEICATQGCKVNVPVIENSRLRSTFGRVISHGTKSWCRPVKVEFASFLLNTGTDDEIKDIIKHEAAHYIVTMQTKENHGHDRMFKDMCAKLDCSRDTMRTEIGVENEDELNYKYLIICEDCGKTIGRYHRMCKTLRAVEDKNCNCKLCGSDNLKIKQNWW